MRLILNNRPYKANVEQGLAVNLLPGNNLILAYTTDESGISFKHPDRYFLKNFLYDEVDDGFDPSSPHLFYLGPEGTYSSRDRIFLDFLLVANPAEGNAVMVELTIDGQSHLLKNKTAYAIEGLGRGRHSLRIRLVDREQKTIPGPFNDSGDRYVVIE